MNCPKCGAPNPNDVKFCTSCGEQLAKPVNGAKDPSKKKRLFIMIGAAAAVLLLVILIAMAFSGNAAKNAADDLCDAIVEMDANAVMKSLPPAVLDYFSDTLKLKDTNVRILRDVKELDEDAVKDIDERYKLSFGTEDGYVEAATIVYVELEVPERKLPAKPIPLVMIKVDGKWYLDILTTADEIGDTDEAFSGFDFSSFTKNFK